MMTAWTAELCGLRDPQAEEMELVQRVKQAKEEGRDEDNRPCVGLEATVGTVVQFQTTSDWMMQTNQPTEWKTGIITQMTTDRFSEGGEVRVTVQYDTGAETDDSTEVHAERSAAFWRDPPNRGVRDVLVDTDRPTVSVSRHPSL